MGMDQLKRTQEISRLAKHLRKAEFLTIGPSAFTGSTGFHLGLRKFETREDGRALAMNTLG